MHLSASDSVRLAELLSDHVREKMNLNADLTPGVSDIAHPEHCRVLSAGLVRYLNTGEEVPPIFRKEGGEPFGGVSGANEFLVKGLDSLQALQASDAPESEIARLARQLQLQPERLQRLDTIIP